VFPRYEVEYGARIPDGVSYELLDLSEIDEEGTGYFRDTWRISQSHRRKRQARRAMRHLT
jgi:hypothetical protein